MEPKQPPQRYSYWLHGTSRMYADYSKDVEAFIDCYETFYGTAGKCDHCFGQLVCERLCTAEKERMNLEVTS